MSQQDKPLGTCQRFEAPHIGNHPLELGCINWTPANPLEDVARQIADHLFARGADRLVLASATNRDMGGWNKQSVVKVIVKFLKAKKGVR